MPVADILCCKPSELAFYPLPKLMIRRVGDHEAHSATRAVRETAVATVSRFIIQYSWIVVIAYVRGRQFDVIKLVSVLMRNHLQY